MSGALADKPPNTSSSSQGQDYMMSGALADGPSNTSTKPIPDDLCVYDKITSGPNCVCKSVPAGTETYQGHYHIIQGIVVIRGERYFQCGVLCSDDIVTAPYEYLKTSCPDLVSFSLCHCFLQG